MLPTRKPIDRAAPTVVSIAMETFRATVANRRQQRTAVAMIDSYVFHNAVARPRVPIMGLAFGDEFAYIAKAAAKRKAAERRERRKLLAQDPQAIEESGNFFGYDDFDGGDNDSIGGNYDDNVGNTGIASLDNVHATPDAKVGALTKQLMSLFFFIVSHVIPFSFLLYSPTDTSNLEVIEFEALCQAHIKSFARRGEVRSRDQPDKMLWRMAEQVGPYS